LEEAGVEVCQVAGLIPWALDLGKQVLQQKTMILLLRMQGNIWAFLPGHLDQTFHQTPFVAEAC
jgi:hypothetical protein